MKRVLLFLLLFGTGLGILLWFQGPGDPDEGSGPPVGPSPLVPESDLQPPPAVTPEPPVVQGPEQDTRPFTTVPGEQGATRVRSSGRIEYTEADPQTQARSMHVKVTDHDSRGEGAIDLQGVEIWWYDDDGQDERMRLEAAKAIGRLVVEPELAVDPDYPITLNEVQISAHQGPPFAPLKMTTRLVEGRLRDRHFTSREPVTVLGDGLDARGTGLDFEGLDERVRILEDPRVIIDFDDGTRITLDSSGPFGLENRPDLGADTVVARAVQAARLVVGGGLELEVEADSIVLVGTERGPGPEAGRLHPVRVEAEGNVRLLATGGVYTGERAVLTFGADSQPERAVLHGSPTVELDLEVSGDDLPEGLESGRLDLVADGIGPLQLDFGARLDMVFEGPVDVRVPALDTTLQARGRVIGSRPSGAAERDRGFDTLSALGGVTVRNPSATLDTEALDVSSLLDLEELPAVRLVARGATRSEGTLQDGRAFEVQAREGLVFLGLENSFRIPEGRGVTLTVLGEKGFTASAERVRDLDGETLAFTADGDVRFENAAGVSTGERFLSHGGGHAELFGTPERLARLEVPEGTVDGGWIEYEGATVTARDEVAIDVAIGEVRYRLAGAWAQLDRSRALEGDEHPPALVLDAGGRVHAEITRPGAEGEQERYEIDADLMRLEAEGRESEGPDVPAGPLGNLELSTLEPTALTASGDVHFSSSANYELRGQGDRLEIDHDGSGRLFPADFERARLEGELPTKPLRFEMTAEVIDFSADSLVARNPDIEVEGIVVELGQGGPRSTRARGISGLMAADRESILFSEGVYLGQLTTQGEGWSINTENVLLTGHPEQDRVPGAPVAELFDTLLAWGGFVARLGSNTQARGEHMQVDRRTGVMATTGSPAVLTNPDFEWTAEWFELNLDTNFIRAGRGQVRSLVGASQGWTLRYTSLEPLQSPDESIQILREPIMISGNGEVRAAWALFWVDSEEWGRMTGGVMGRPTRPEPVPVQTPTGPEGGVQVPLSLFGQIDTSELSRWLREVYFEGNIEYSINGERRARAEAAYLDLIDGHGWMRQFDMTMQIPFTSSRERRFKLRAEWLRHSADGSVRADSAVATTCDFEEPHFVIRIGDLRVNPRTKERPGPGGPGQPATVQEPDGWDVSARKSSIQFWRGIAMPVPKIGFPMTRELKVDTEQISLGGLRPLSFGSDAKFGTFIGTTVTQPLGVVARRVHRILGGRPDLVDLEGDTSYGARWLSSRGLFFSLESELGSEGLYWLRPKIDGIFDRGEDRGLVRVDSSDRDDLRAWFHARGRYLLGDDGQSWLDLVYSQQTDAGLQSEFQESDFLRFEERENYLHYRKADGNVYTSATAETRLDDFRTEVVDEPTAGLFRGRARLGEVAGRPLLYTSNTTASHLRRLEGNVLYEAPFADGLGERDLSRLDTSHRFESPVPLGFGGLRAVPFLEGRGTAWSESATDVNAIARGALFGGLQIATTLWKFSPSGRRHELTPSIGYRRDLVHEESPDMRVVFDPTDTSLEGEFINVGLRSRWTHADSPSVLDIELQQTWADEQAVSTADGVQPIRFQAGWLTQVANMPFGVSHESRYLIEDAQTIYSRSFVGIEPLPAVDIDAGYHSARDLAGNSLYNAFSVGGRYTFSPKWEIEANGTFSSSSGGRLSSGIEVRRFGHDFVFSLETSFRSGEGGGTSYRFNLYPLLLWRRGGTSLLDRWRRQNL